MMYPQRIELRIARVPNLEIQERALRRETEHGGNDLDRLLMSAEKFKKQLRPRR